MCKKILCILTCFLVLTSCGVEQVINPPDSSASNEVTSGDVESGRLINFLNISNNGELFTDSQVRLCFFDFTIMDSVVICSKPNCRHIEEDGCSSFGMHRAPFIHDGHIYFFEIDAYVDKNEIVFNERIVRADIDGTNRRVLLTLEDMEKTTSNILLMGDTLYFGMRTLDYDELSINTDDSTAKLYSYDLKKGEFSELFSMKKGYNCGAEIDGEFNGEVYFTISYLEEPYVFDPDTPPEFILETYKYSPSDGSVSERDSEYYPFSGCIIHFEDEGITFYFEDGRELYIPDITTNSTRISIIDDFIIDVENKFAVEISSGKRYAVNGVEISDHIIYYMDGAYIIKRLNVSAGKYEYRKLIESDLIGEEM